ncbi:MAG: TIGR03745 family integrating conjugative element membrane protein [Blastopirellula sp.]|nr:MAG: TIGR03745 family integrating conjugative element membrane protein [Blastopirellula sp.]
MKTLATVAVPKKRRHGLSRVYQALCLGLFSMAAQAQLPTPVNPTNGAPNGNYLSFMQGWTGDAVDYIALAISGAGFLWIGWILLSKFNEARVSNDPDWGSVGLTAVIAGVLLAIVSFFLNEATGII